MNIIIPDNLGDWRLETVLVLRGDQVLPSGYKAKDGEHMWKTSVTRDGTSGMVGFPTPQPVSLFLDSALSSAIRGRTYRKEVTFPKIMADGSHQAEGEHVPILYEYFEACMAACVFSFFSIEVFANQCIWENITKPFEVQREKKKKSYAPDDLQKIPTEEKLKQVLPSIFQKKTRMPSQLWNSFTRLTDIRHSIVHLKSHNHYVRWKEDKSSVYHVFLNNDPAMYPQAAIDVMRFFVERGKRRWLDAAEDYLKGVKTA